MTWLTNLKSLHCPVTQSHCHCLRVDNVFLQASQVITRLRIAEPHELSSLRLVGRILLDWTLQELAELFVELLVATLLLDDVCKLFEAPLDFSVAHHTHVWFCVGFLCCQLVSVVLMFLMMMTVALTMLMMMTVALTMLMMMTVALTMLMIMTMLMKVALPHVSCFSLCVFTTSHAVGSASGSMMGSACGAPVTQGQCSGWFWCALESKWAQNKGNFGRPSDRADWTPPAWWLPRRTSKRTLYGQSTKPSCCSWIR